MLHWTVRGRRQLSTDTHYRHYIGLSRDTAVSTERQIWRRQQCINVHIALRIMNATTAAVGRGQ